MAGGLIYIVIEYCTQSHLSTEDYGRAMTGLKQCVNSLLYSMPYFVLQVVLTT